ncbi:MAG TPA: ribonuclease HII [Candidatus Nanoarchaeia archaeon]|nr:ribonuclease HII [Candidatus Nanoarchaeia archaeon]
MTFPKIIVGVDEAGRGPVLGPLVMAALAVKEEDEKKLKWIGVKDSKLLSSEVREELFERIREIVHDFRIEVIEPDAIDLSVAGGNSNLNWLEAETSARLVSELNPDKIIVDCPSVNIQAYKNYFSARLSEGVRNNAELLMEHKADLNHVVVAAASIVAKVIRDRQIEHLKNDIGLDFGSGYLTDPKTQAFLTEHSEKYAHLFRKSWKPYSKMIEGKKQSKLGGFMTENS